MQSTTGHQGVTQEQRLPVAEFHAVACTQHGHGIGEEYALI